MISVPATDKTRGTEILCIRSRSENFGLRSLITSPQCGQVSAFSDIGPPHSLHCTIAIERIGIIDSNTGPAKMPQAPSPLQSNEIFTFVEQGSELFGLEVTAALHEKLGKWGQ